MILQIPMESILLFTLIICHKNIENGMDAARQRIFSPIIQLFPIHPGSII